MSEPESHQVIIVGGGPAGMSAALWCADLGIKCLLIDRGLQLGGQMRWTHNPITNYLGVTAANGSELADVFEGHLRDADVRIVTGLEVLTCEVQARTLRTADGRSFASEALIFATGVRRRSLGVPGEDDFADRGILESGARDRELTRGKKVVIIGGGDAAIENAMILSEYAERVTVLHRGDKFRSREDFLAKARLLPNVVLVENARVLRLNGGAELSSITVLLDGVETQTECDLVLIRIGIEPNTGLFPDDACATARDGILVLAPKVVAIGDVTGPIAPTISSAVGAGATAAKYIAGTLSGF